MISKLSLRLLSVPIGLVIVALMSGCDPTVVPKPIIIKKPPSNKAKASFVAEGAGTYKIEEQTILEPSGLGHFKFVGGGGGGTISPCTNWEEALAGGVAGGCSVEIEVAGGNFTNGEEATLETKWTRNGGTPTTIRNTIRMEE